MKVLLIYPDYPEWGAGGCYYTGVASVYASLRKAGHAPVFWHVTKPLTREQFLNHIQEIGPDVIGFSSTTPMHKYVEEWAHWVKGIFLVCGGIHARLNPVQILSETPISAVCTGEGEISFPKLLDKLNAGEDYTDTPNFAFRVGSKIVQNGLELIQNLDLIPDPDRSIFDYASLYDSTKDPEAKTATFMFSRGCPFSCSYCCNEALRRNYPDPEHYVRHASPSRAIDQILSHIDRHDTDYVRIDDSDVNLNAAWFKRFARLYGDKVSIPYVCQTRPDLCTHRFIEQLKDSGCIMLIMGVEHAGEQYRNDVLNRSITDREIRSAFKQCRDADLATRSFNMFGLPYDTVDRMLDTIKLNAEIEAYDMSIAMFYPFPGTRLAQTCEEEGFALTKVESAKWPNFVLNQPSVSVEQTYLTYSVAHILLRRFRENQRAQADDIYGMNPDLDESTREAERLKMLPDAPDLLHRI